MNPGDEDGDRERVKPSQGRFEGIREKSINETPKG